MRYILDTLLTTHTFKKLLLLFSISCRLAKVGSLEYHIPRAAGGHHHVWLDDW